MNKGNKVHKLGRNPDQRKALLASLAHDLVLNGEIRTTEAKAKALRPFVERLITHGKKGTVASRRHIMRFVSKRATHKLCDELGPYYQERHGGYTRIIKMPYRESDVSKMAIIELVK
jgi:large subunit ribosomal protein L17